MGMSEAQMDKHLLRVAGNYVRHLDGVRVEPEVRQTAWVWDYYYQLNLLLKSNRTKKARNVKPDPA